MIGIPIFEWGKGKGWYIFVLQRIAWSVSAAWHSVALVFLILILYIMVLLQQSTCSLSLPWSCVELSSGGGHCAWVSSSCLPSAFSENCELSWRTYTLFETRHNSRYIHVCPPHSRWLGQSTTSTRVPKRALPTRISECDQAPTNGLWKR